MNGEKLMEHLNNIDDDMILESEEARRLLPARKTRLLWQGFGAVAAAAAVFLMVIMYATPQTTTRRGGGDDANDSFPWDGMVTEMAVPDDAEDDDIADTDTVPGDGGFYIDDAQVGDAVPIEPPPPAYHPSGLPMLFTWRAMHSFGDGMGIVGSFTTDLEKTIGSPPDITGMQFYSLPVFRSPMLFLPTGHNPLAMDTPDTDAMFAHIEEIAALFDLRLEDAEIEFYTIDEHFRYWADFIRSLERSRENRDREILEALLALGDDFAERVISATAWWGDFGIEAYNTNLPHRTRLHIPIDDFPMPQEISARFEHNFATHDVTDAQAERMTQFFLEHFSALVNFDAPVIDIVTGYIFPPDEFFRIHFWHSFAAYESADGDEEKVLGYNFNRVYFVAGMESEDFPASNLHARVELRHPDFLLSQKIGDYPVISLEEARQALLEGRYITAGFADDPPTEESIVRADLVYLTHWQEVFMPFYRFTVEVCMEGLHGWGGILRYAHDYHGMRMYLWYFVPAVHPEFLADFPDAHVFFQ